MLRSYRVKIRCLSDPDLSTDESAIKSLLNEVDFGRRVQFSDRPIDLGPDSGVGPSLIMVIPVATFLGAFAKSFGGKLGEQSAEAVGKAFSEWLRRAHHSLEPRSAISPTITPETVIVYDKKRQLKVSLPANLPADAYDKLVTAATTDKKASAVKGDWTYIEYTGNEWR